MRYSAGRKSSELACLRKNTVGFRVVSGEFHSPKTLRKIGRQSRSKHDFVCFAVVAGGWSSESPNINFCCFREGIVLPAFTEPLHKSLQQARNASCRRIGRRLVRRLSSAVAYNQSGVSGPWVGGEFGP